MPPPNIGPRSTPNYALFAGGVQQVPPIGMRVFAGQRDEGFYVDLGIFDLLGVGTGQVEDSTAGVQREHAGDPGADVAADAQRCASVRAQRSERDHRRLVDGEPTRRSPPDPPAAIDYSGDLVQVSRLGMPLVNEAVIDLARKDVFNAIEPTSDSAALDRVLDPEVPKLLDLVFGVKSPPAPRQDLVTIFLTGIPGLNQPPGVRPSEMLRLNMGIPPVGVDDPGLRPQRRAARRCRRVPERPTGR